MRSAVLCSAVLVGASLLASGVGSARAEGSGSAFPVIPEVLPTQIIPLTLRVLQHSIVPVRATEGLIHLACAAQTTNVNLDRSRIDQIVPVAPLNYFRSPAATSSEMNTERTSPIWFVRSARLWSMPSPPQCLPIRKFSTEVSPESHPST